MAKVDKKSKPVAEAIGDKKLSMKEVRQLRHMRNAEKKVTTGSVFARARRQGIVGTKTQFRNYLKNHRSFVESAPQRECLPSY